MKHFIQISVLFFCSCICHAQQNKIDSLNRLIAKATSDTQRINLLIKKADAFQYVSFDSLIHLYNKAIRESQSVNYKHGELFGTIDLADIYAERGYTIMAKKNLDNAYEFLKTIKDSTALVYYYYSYGDTYFSEGRWDSSLMFYKKTLVALPDSNRRLGVYLSIGNVYYEVANFPDAFTYYQKALSIAEKINDQQEEAVLYLNISGTLYSMGDNLKAEQYGLYAIKLAERTGDKLTEDHVCETLSSIYNHIHKYKEAYTYGMDGAGLAKIIVDQEGEALCLSDAARSLAESQKLNEAEKLNKRAIVIADSSHQREPICATYAVMGEILKIEGKDKEAIPFYEKSCQSIQGANLFGPDKSDYFTSLSECYEKTGNFNKALETYKIATKINDTLKNMQNIRKATELEVSYEFKKKQELTKAIQDKKDADTKRKRTQQYFIIAGLAVIVLAFIAIALIQFRNNKQKQKANALLQQQKKEIEQQKQKVESTLEELKSTQAQLIQSEKMASLGELTAGIAHEIQNPLNFVNNFSEVNRELISELVDEVDKGNTEEVKVIANDIKDNEEKINHHGKRADAIVKGMLQHSKQTKGIKEPTDINALCDEYLRLSYHGLRAKDKNFNADFKTDFDETIGKINIVPQDMGRVMLNLFNNAFYAVSKSPTPKGEEYKPLVSVSTRQITPLQGSGAAVEIVITDNGNGIPSNIIDKIFQPFFTTKPTGEGTGLGLSLAYDIITKEHNGKIKVESKEGEGTVFIIQLDSA